jgi:ParB-like chromosome segregation protein Spo0J
MHPVVVTPDGTLIAGERRLAAFKLLGKTHIPVTIVALDDIVRGEFAENTARKNFTLSEAVAIKHALEPIERAEAKKRQGERTDKHLGKLPTSSKGRAGDEAAKETGMSRRTLEKAEAVIAAAAAEPERYGKLVEDMDETGRVDRAFKQLQIARAKERHAKVIEHGCTVDDLAHFPGDADLCTGPPCLKLIPGIP